MRTPGRRNIPRDEKTSMRYEAARLYYERNETMEDIGARLGVSASLVKNLLKEAKEKHIVRFQVAPAGFQDLENKLTRKFRPWLKHAVVVPTSHDPDQLRIGLGRAAAQYFETQVKENNTIALGGGPSLFRMVEAIKWRKGAINVYPTAIPTLGNEIRHLDPHMLVAQLTFKCGWNQSKGYAMVLPPQFSRLDEDVTKAQKQLDYEHNAAKANRAVADLCRKIETTTFDYLFITCGPLQYGIEKGASHLSTVEGVKDRGWHNSTFRSAQIVGDVAYNFVTKEGQLLLRPYLGLNIKRIKELVEKKNVVLVAGGKDSADIVAVALCQQFCNVVITDQSVATLIADNPKFTSG